MKKTLLLTHEYYPFKGGVARYCYNLFKFFPKDKYLVVTDNEAVKTADNILQQKLTSKFTKPSWLFSSFKLKQIVKEHKIEQIFTPNILPLGSLAYFLELPYIISLHGMDINLALKNKPHLTKKILGKASKIIVNSESTLERIKDFGFDDKIHLLYPTIDVPTSFDKNKPGTFSDSSKKVPGKLQELKNKYNIGDSKVLLTVGRLNKRKAQDLVIQAIAKLKDNLAIKYFIVGQGNRKKSLQNTAKRNKVDDRVFILDEVEDQDLVYYYKMADAFVLPNRESKTDVEGFGMVFLEAANYGLPIIAGASGGVTEILTDKQDAILVKSDDLEALETAISQLLNNPQEADKLAKQALIRAKSFPGAKEQSKVLEQLL